MKQFMEAVAIQRTVQPADLIALAEDLKQPKPKTKADMMKKLTEILREKLLPANYTTETSKQSMLTRVLQQLTRIQHQESDFSFEFDLTPDGLVIKFLPLTSYGRFALQELFDQTCAEEIPK